MLAATAQMLASSRHPLHRHLFAARPLLTLSALEGLLSGHPLLTTAQRFTEKTQASKTQRRPIPATVQRTIVLSAAV